MKDYNKKRKKLKKFHPSENIKNLKTVTIPESMQEKFGEAEKMVAKYFESFKWEPETGRILIGGERYILIRASAARLNVPETLASMLDLEGGMNNPLMINLIYHYAKALGKADAKKFHLSMGLDEVIDKLSTGPIHYAFTGWGRVNIKSESNPTPNENYYLIYAHTQSFEADSFLLTREEKSYLPFCIMNAGYSAGWCGECFDLNLDAREITCRAKGDKECLFIMAPEDKLEERIVEYYQKITK